jgi:ATP-dependent Lhr-like helicase
MDPLAPFSVKTRAWFERAFAGPTPAQAAGWPAISTGENVLIQAPTGSGKTLAAFLHGIDRLDSTPGQGLRLLYISPLKALNYDVEEPASRSPGSSPSSASASHRRHSQKERRDLVKEPPDI